MKRVLLIISILLLLVLVSVYSVFYLRDYKNHLINSLETAVGEEVYEVYESWEEKKAFLEMFIKEEKINEISNAILDAALYFDKERIKKAIVLLENLYQSELPTLSNIF